MAVNVYPQVFEITPDAGNSSGFIPMSIGLAKGDILVYQGDGNVKRLPVGQDGQVLTADSTAELGVRWVTP